ncbi:glycosyltransferase family 2 protein [Vibrio bivalvicida]|uniref:Glycosyl transferase n=1 Tax=Vibrio bivalvicida TaxID=1276888 RepID=A0A177Y6P7_9VIBR|nr:glycosyltransferase family 2 protein [Vibrio bivalvicida]OAJ96175.1 glycosyl transferase [Vibrio bivalvicida]
MKLSIVTTLYNSCAYILEFHQRVSIEAQKITEQYEVIFVDDGSPDDSLDVAIQLSNEDERVKVIELSRNFGHHKAMMTGLSHAKGELVFLIDSDLEEEPELLGCFYSEMNRDKNDLDVLYGVQYKRKGGLFEKISGQLFYSTLNYLTDLNMSENMVTARLMKKDYVNALVSHDEREIFIAGLWQITGFNQKAVAIKKHSSSETTYSLRHKLSILENSIVSFSNKPLKLIFHTGLWISVISFIYILYIVYKNLFHSISIEGWSSLIASIWFLGGLIILFVGMLGIYMSKIYTESKRRPYSIIRRVYEKRQ